MFGFLLSSYTFVHAQTCPQVLRLARSTYEQGRLHELETLLKGCLEGVNFTVQERVEAYKLLTLAYIYLEEPEKADAAMLKLLQTDHYFVLNKAVEPAEFQALYATFRTTPIFRIGGKFGALSTQPNVARSNTANDGASEYGYKIGVTAGAFAEIPVLNNKFVLNPELNFQLRNFSFTNNNGIASTTASEAMSTLALPVSLQYSFFQKREKVLIRPYLALGVQLDYLLSSSQTITTLKIAELPVPEKTYDVKNQRNPLNVSAIASIGGKLDAGPGYLILEARYYYGLSKLLTAKDVYSNPFPVFDNYAVNGIFSLNSVSITLGYGYNIFKPKKKLTK